MKRHLTLLATVGLLAAAGFWGLPQMSATTPGETQAADTLPQAARTDRPTPPSLHSRLPKHWPTVRWPAPQSLPIWSWTARGN
ncbi:hypothetical protein ACMG4L_16315 [Alcanivorax sp. IL1]|uniref:hypothetical protein n=1 Tax=Alcanivorax sp. IL1 TaxID=3396308 RepID=UPI0039C002E4